MVSVLVIRLRSLRLLRVSGIVMRLRMFLLLITFLKASHSFRNRLLVICKNAYLFATMIMTSVSSPFSCCSKIMRQMLTQAQTAGQYFTNDQIKEMTRKVSAEVDLVHQQTQNQRYGSSHIGATAKDISNVVTDAASGVVDIF